MNKLSIIVIMIAAAAIIILYLLSKRRKRKLPPLVLRILIWVRSTIRHTARCVKQRALLPLYKKRLSKAFVELASEREPIKLSDLESTFSEGAVTTVAPEEEETEKELLVLMN